MNLFMNLRVIIPLMTLMTGILLPTNIAEAASNAPTDKASIKQETVKNEEHTEEHHGTGGIPQLFFSKTAQKIELSIFLGAIVLSIVIPELRKSRKKPARQQEQVKKIEQDVVSLEVIRENRQTSSLAAGNGEKFNNQEKIKLENQSEQEQKTA